MEDEDTKDWYEVGYGTCPDEVDEEIEASAQLRLVGITTILFQVVYVNQGCIQEEVGDEVQEVWNEEDHEDDLEIAHLNLERVSP